MKESCAVRTARLLRVLVYVALAVNVLCIPCVPQLVVIGVMGQYLPSQSLPYILLLEGYFILCGACTAVILWQAKRILDTILTGDPFRSVNAKAMNRAAVCCWVISAASLVRLVAEIVMLDDPAILFTYNTAFVPVFFMAGLLFRVMGALFQQASELQEDQDLTI